MRGLAAAMSLAGLLAAPALAEGPGMPEPLTDQPGDPERGRAIVVDRQTGLCILCHPGPFPELQFQGNLAPDLTGVGAKLSPAELRLRLVDSRLINPDTIMPPFYSTEGLSRVGERWKGQTVLTALQIEDVVSYLSTLTEGGVPDR